MANEMIRLEKLNKVFPGKPPVAALTDIDLAVDEGEIFGIIGLSGAGKSTLVRCINFLERPTSGSVTVNGRQLDRLNERELLETRRSIGMIFQQFNLLMQRNALQNVCFPLELAGFSKAEAKSRASELMRLVGLTDKENAFPAQLSGGQKQRVAIARALATQPKVLLCDEATSALDPTTTRSILALLKDINKNLGITVVVITHEMSVIEEICSRVAIIDESRIVETGAVEDIFARPKTKAARRLIFPEEHTPATFEGGKRLRIVFDGNASVEPIMGSMMLECGAPVNILRADMKSIGGKTFGQMLVELPNHEQTVHRMRKYLSAHNVQFEEEEEA
ncbi:MAG: ATP-binding cassette domain-containing protein [Clostridiaceae bacterium]|nr:ATP-binding cassette domain-containing protein [Eubacteriales bacterium]